MKNLSFINKSLFMISKFRSPAAKFLKKANPYSFKTKLLLVCFLGFFFFVGYFAWIFLSLPRLLSMSDYKPPLLTEVFDRKGNKIGEFFKQRRKLFKYEDMPKIVISAFVAAEDGEFFNHKGLNYRAILRALLVNLKAGRKVQGGSTITQQVARTLLLSSKKTYTRKLKEAILSLRMENVLSKQDILYIYLNQIYLGHGAYGIEMASQIYFRKSVTELSLAEASLLAGLPKAPSRFSPIFNPPRAKSRQTYVLMRMREDGYISPEVFQKTVSQPVKVFVREKFNKISPYYLETVRRLLLDNIENEGLLTLGLKVYTAMDLEKQKIAQKALRKGLEQLDQRQGFRGVLTQIKNKEEEEELFKESKKALRKILKTHLIIPGLELKTKESNSKGFMQADLFLEEALKNLKISEITDEQMVQASQDHLDLLEGEIFKALITKVSEDFIEIKTIFGVSRLELVDLDWAVPISKKEEQGSLQHPNESFKSQDVIFVKIKEAKEDEDLDKLEEESPKKLALELYQEPLVEGALISFDLNSDDVLAMVGGYSFNRSQFNRAYQSLRQAGSVFKPFVYGAALEKGFRPNSIISDMPLVFSDEEAEGQKLTKEEKEKAEEAADQIWRPVNISNRFSGDILFRSALIRSLNVPTIKIMEKIGLAWVRFYTRQLGIFSPLNPDYTMALGSSSVSLYEVVKAFATFPRQGKKIRPVLVYKVESAEGEILLEDQSMDHFFNTEIEQTKEFVKEQSLKWFPALKEESDQNLEIMQGNSQPEEEAGEDLLVKEKTSEELRKNEWVKILEEDEEQVIPASNSYIVNSLLEAIVFDPEGTARRARALKRPLAGKTGTTNGYYDTWFVGHSPLISAGVWVGFDNEKTLGRGETGSRVALPIWMNYMKEAHKDLPTNPFPIPERIIFVNIDGEKGGLVSPSTQKFVHQAFVEGTEPTGSKNSKSSNQNLEEEENPSFNQEDESHFIKGDF